METLEISPERWEEEIHRSGACAGCGGREGLKAFMVVPVNKGGKFFSSNGYLLCRRCEMRSWGERKRESYDSSITMYLPEALYRSLIFLLESPTDKQLGGIGGLFRLLSTRLVEDPERYADLKLYQFEGGSDVKLYFELPLDTKEALRRKAAEYSMTMTDVLKALGSMYVEAQGGKDE